MIAADIEAKILRLHDAERWPPGTIAHQLGIHHGTVRRALVRAGVPNPEPTPRPTLMDPFLGFVQETLKAYPKLCSSRLFQMVKERGYSGGPDHFRHLLARHRPRPPAEAYLRLRTLCGEQGQVDWAHFGKVKIGRAERYLMAFVMVLSWSRWIFLRFYLDQKIANLLRGHQEAFAVLQGVPRVLLYDNPKNVVLERQGDAIRFHPQLLAFAGHHRYEPRPVAPRRGNEKGRVERAIQYCRTSFWPARKWVDLDDLNEQAARWCATVAADRPCPEDKTWTVREAFEQEKPKLLALPADPFPTEERVEVSVPKTPYVRFDRNDYSVPHTLVRRTLTVVADLERVRILDGATEAASHPRTFDCDQVVENPAHVAVLVAEKRAAREHRGLDLLARTIPRSQELMVMLAEQGGNLGNATQTLLRYVEIYGATATSAAVAEALAKGAPHPRSVRNILDRDRQRRGLTAPLALTLPDHPKVRDLIVKPHDLESYDGLQAEKTSSPPEDAAVPVAAEPPGDPAEEGGEQP
jgi:transposase